MFEGELDRGTALALSIALKLFCTGLNLFYCALLAMAVPRRLCELIELGASTSLSRNQTTSSPLSKSMVLGLALIFVQAGAGFLGIARLW